MRIFVLAIAAVLAVCPVSAQVASPVIIDDGEGCYSFLNSVQGMIEMYSFLVSDLTLPERSDPMFDLFRDPLQGLTDLQREVATVCVAMKPA